MLWDLEIEGLFRGSGGYSEGGVLSRMLKRLRLSMSLFGAYGGPCD